VLPDAVDGTINKQTNKQKYTVKLDLVCPLFGLSCDALINATLKMMYCNIEKIMYCNISNTATSQNQPGNMEMETSQITFQCCNI
jgi:hypothetical protein